MNITDQARSLLQGAYDLHIHSAPDILPRKGDDLEFARRAAEAGMAGIVIKSHYTLTAERAKLVQQLVPGVKIFGAIALDHAVGGLNPVALDVAGRSGARVVWFPTVDAANEIAYLESHPDSKKPYWYKIQMDLREKGITRPPLSVLGEDGKLLPVVYELFDVIASHKMILATGHLGVPEIMAIVKEGRAYGLERIVVTHPEFPSVALPTDLQVEVARQGAFLERCYHVAHSGKCSWEQVFADIRTVGVSSTILSTDSGQPTGLWPADALADYYQHLLDAGFSTAEIRTMGTTNPGGVVNI
jgi:hypothetical protein